ncbi:MAG: NUDIX domain-containing protein [Bacteroidetes bacterium]|nr:NUDIX domain-containing protein [Bacteroidota bacterium]
MIKVFVNDKPFIFSENFTSEKYLRYIDCPTPVQLMNDFKRPDISGGYYTNHSLPEAFEGFCDQFRCINAAGGLVYNAEGKLLMIKRLGKWDLPKGKIDPGETAEEAALREVCEETGICNTTIVAELPGTYHIYKLNDKIVLKHTFWFKMLSNAVEKISPQTEEDILEVRWMLKNEVHDALANSYGSIRDLLSEIFTV